MLGLQTRVSNKSLFLLRFSPTAAALGDEERVDETLFDSTGMFHWCHDRDLDENIIVR